MKKTIITGLLIIQGCSINEHVSAEKVSELYNRQIVCQISSKNGVDQLESFKIVDLYLQHINLVSDIVMPSPQDDMEEWLLSYIDSDGHSVQVLIDKSNGLFTVDGKQFSLDVLKNPSCG